MTDGFAITRRLTGSIAVQGAVVREKSQVKDRSRRAILVPTTRSKQVALSLGVLTRNLATITVRRLCIWLAAVAFVLLIAVPASSQKRPRLIVYLSTTIRARALEEALSSKLTQAEIVVCSRYRDFEREVAKPFDAAMALQPVLRAHKLRLDLKGLRDEKDTEPYVLLANGTAVGKADLPKLTIGAVDLLGRHRTGPFIADLLGLKAPPDIKYVIKSEDLLPLLQFGTVRAVLVSEETARLIKGLSKLDLRSTPLDHQVGIAAVSFNTEYGRSALRGAIQSMELETNRKLGVDAWR